MLQEGADLITLHAEISVVVCIALTFVMVIITAVMAVMKSSVKVGLLHQ